MIENQFLVSIIKIMLTFFVALITLGLIAVFIVIPMVIKGDEVEVPNVRGMSLDESMSKLQESGLIARKNPQERASSRFKAGHVLEQEPPPGVKVKRKREIYLTLSTGSKNIKVPDLRGKLLREAKTVILEWFSIGNLAKVHSDDFPAVNTIIAQTPLPGSIAPRGTEISLLLSAGVRPKMLLMPDLVGKKLADIRENIKKVGLNLRQKSVPSREYGEGTILSHKPEANQIVKVGQNIDFEVSGTDILAGKKRRPVVVKHIVTPSVIPEEIVHRHVRIVVRDESKKGTKIIVDKMFKSGELITKPTSVVGEAVMMVYEDDMAQPIAQKRLF